MNNLSIFLLLAVIAIYPTLQPAVAVHPSVMIGIYVYTWYEPLTWDHSITPDRPVIGYYDSSDPHVISTQLNEIASLGINYVILNWLGVASFSDRVVGKWYALAKVDNVNLQLCIMVEPYAETVGYDYRAIYDRAYSLYRHYPDQSLQIDDRPVIFFYNSPVLTGDSKLTLPRDPRFTVMTSGHREYVDFWYSYVRGLRPAILPHGDQISVTPRFDDYLQYEYGLRNHTDIVDRYLDQGLYDDQWQRALVLADHNMIRWITISTWNEYPERTMIEPHYDATAINQNPYHLYNITKLYIALLRKDTLPP